MLTPNDMACRFDGSPVPDVDVDALAADLPVWYLLVRWDPDIPAGVLDSILADLGRPGMLSMPDLGLRRCQVMASRTREQLEPLADRVRAAAPGHVVVMLLRDAVVVDRSGCSWLLVDQRHRFFEVRITGSARPPRLHRLGVVGGRLVLEHTFTRGEQHPFDLAVTEAVLLDERRVRRSDLWPMLAVDMAALATRRLPQARVLVTSSSLSLEVDQPGTRGEFRLLFGTDRPRLSWKVDGGDTHAGFAADLSEHPHPRTETHCQMRAWRNTLARAS